MLFIFATAAFFAAITWMLSGSYLSPARFPSGQSIDGFEEASLPFTGYSIPLWRGGSGRDKFILVHGYGGNRGYWSHLAPLLALRGEVIIPATCGQDTSPSQTVGFGLGESLEIGAIAQMLRSREPDCRIHLVGVSQGGAACWLAAGRDPQQYASVTTEAAFARLDWAVDEFLGVRLRAAPMILQPVVGLAEVRSGIRRSQIRPVEAASHFRGPCLILMSRNDGMFSTRHAEALANAIGTDVKWFEHESHAQIMVDRSKDIDEMIGDLIGEKTGEPSR